MYARKLFRATLSTYNIYMINRIIMIYYINNITLYIPIYLPHPNPVIYDETGSVDHAAQ